MKKYTKEEIIEKLMLSGYPDDESLLNYVYNSIDGFCDEAKDVFEEWYETGKIKEFNICGITNNYLKEFYQMTAPAIIITYDMLCKKPQEVASVLKKGKH